MSAVLYVLAVVLAAMLGAVYIVAGVERLVDAERVDALRIDDSTPWRAVFVVVPAICLWPIVLWWCRRR